MNQGTMVTWQHSLKTGTVKELKIGSVLNFYQFPYIFI